MAATRIVIRKPLIIAAKAAEIATTSRMRKPLRKRSSVSARHDAAIIAPGSGPVNWRGACDASRRSPACAASCWRAAARRSRPSSPRVGGAGAPPSHLLVVTHTAGSVTAPFPTARRRSPSWAVRAALFDVAYARTADDVRRLLTADGLRAFDAVAFVNTTGNLGIPDMAAFLAWIAAGHAFLGVHSASDTYHDDPRYLEMLGNEFETHGDQAEVEVVVDDAGAPGDGGSGRASPHARRDLSVPHQQSRPGRHAALARSVSRRWSAARRRARRSADRVAEDRTAPAACSTPRLATAKTCGRMRASGSICAARCNGRCAGDVPSAWTSPASGESGSDPTRLADHDYAPAHRLPRARSSRAARARRRRRPTR